MLVLWSVSLAAPDWAALRSSDGWEALSSSKTDETGPIDIRLKTLSGIPCLQGQATVTVAPRVLLDVVTDAPAAKRFSSETLIAAEELGRSGRTIDYYQHLDVPGWTMAADRFWVLRGELGTDGDTLSFRWARFDWRTRYPELAERIDTEHAGAIEPDPNFGSWTFEPTAQGTRATYRICSDPGGSLPRWLQKQAATRTLPNTMADVVREAKRRE